ncbi:MAG: EthD family reductase [Novosphingobium sp.]|nr:EthD family reductase [Novosphingobium sp.]
MLKQLCLLTRKPGMSMADFIDYYENRHAPLLAPMMPQARRYVRRYVHPEMNAVSQTVPDIPFDCLTEIWWDSREAFEAGMAYLREGERMQRIREDEKNVFAGPTSPVFSVEEIESPMRGFEDSPALDGLRNCDGTQGALKLVFLLKRRPDMSVQQYRDYYAKSHSKLGERAMPDALRYVRRHVEQEGNLSGQFKELTFDTVMEIWWESREGFADPENQMGEELWNEIYQDEEQLFATHANPVFTVLESDSPMRGW